MATMLGEALDDFLRKTLHKAYIGVQSVVYNIVVEQVMLGILRKYVIKERR